MAPMSGSKRPRERAQTINSDSSSDSDSSVEIASSRLRHDNVSFLGGLASMQSADTKAAEASATVPCEQP
jgi:hypothetical protein